MTPPPGDRIDLSFKSPLSPPDGGAITLDFAPQTVMPSLIGVGQTSAFGRPSVIQSRFIAPRGFDASSLGTVLVDRAGLRVYPTGWSSSTVSIRAVLRFTQFVAPTGFVVRHIVPGPALHRAGGYIPPAGGPNLILNFETPLHPPPGTGMVLEFAPGSTHLTVRGVSLGVQTQWGVPTVSQTSVVRPASVIASTAVGVPTVESSIRRVGISEGIPPGGVGGPRVSNSAASIRVPGIPPQSAVGSHRISHWRQQLLPVGIPYGLVGRPVVENRVRSILLSGQDLSSLGKPSVTRGVQSLSAQGFDASYYGSVSVENKTRYYNLSGWVSSVVPDGHKVWDGVQYVVRVSLGDGLLVPAPTISRPGGVPSLTRYIELSGYGIGVPDNQVWPAHKVESTNRSVFPEGFTSYGVGSPRLEQTIYLSIHLLGADWSIFGTPSVDQTIKLISPDGLDSLYISPSLQIWNRNTDIVAGGFNSFVSGAHTVTRGTARVSVPGIRSAETVPATHRVSFKRRALTPGGWEATLWGTAVVQSRNISVYPGGIAPPSQTEPRNENRQVPDPGISYRTRRVTDAGGIASPALSTKHILTHWVQYVDLAAQGVVPRPVGTPTISFRYRTIYPTFIAGPAWGRVTVSRKIYVQPQGWVSSAVSDVHELLVNARRVRIHSGERDPAQYGIATVINQRQDIDLFRQGWLSEHWGAATVYNRTQHVVVAPYAENVDPDSWPRYAPLVENHSRVLRLFGHQSSRVGLSTWIHNKAEAFKPVGQDMCVWGADTFIAHRHRTVNVQGWDSFYNTAFTVVWNKADVIGPVGIGDTSQLGRPDPVANLNRTVKHHSGWEGPVFGTAFIAYARRTVRPGLFYDVPASYPDVRHNPYPIAPKGIPPAGQVGGHEVRIFWRTASPKSVNVHDPWIGIPTVENRNREITPYAYDYSEWGRPDVQNHTRYIRPEGASSLVFGLHSIARRTRIVVPHSLAAPRIVDTHRIRNVLPDPPSLQKILLDIPGREEGYGIPPRGMGSILVRFPTIYPEGIHRAGSFGKLTVRTNAIAPRFIFEDGLFGKPVFVFTQYVSPTGIPSKADISQNLRLTPWHIYVPLGDQMPYGYTPRRADAHLINAHTSVSRNGSSFPWFGDVAVSNKNRVIGPVPTRWMGGENTGFDFFPKFGQPEVALKNRILYPRGIRSLRFGQVVILGVPQYINLDDTLGDNHQGIENKQQFGDVRVGFPAVAPDFHRRIYPRGDVLTQFSTNTRVELLHRTITVRSINHRGNPQLGDTSPWGVPMVGFPRRYSIGMGVQTLWGNATIEYLHRTIYPVGHNSSSLEDGNFEDYRFPMRVRRINPRTKPFGFSSEGLGRPFVSSRVRIVHATGFDVYNTGRHRFSSSVSITPRGWDSLQVGDIDRWESGKIKPHGDDLSVLGAPRIRHVVRPGGRAPSRLPTPRVAHGFAPRGIPEIVFAGPSVTNPFGCTNRVIAPLPILSTQTVTRPVAETVP